MPDSIQFDPNNFSKTNPAIGGTFEEVLELLLVHRYSHVSFELENTHASVDLTDFQLLGKVNVDATYQVLITGAGWGSLSKLLEWAVGSFNTLAFGAKAMALLNVTGLYAIKFEAKTGSSGSATIRGTQTRNV